MAGWILIGFVFASMLVGTFIPDGRFKLLGSAILAIAPPALAALSYHQASKTGCSGGDCTGAMIGIAFLGFGAAVISLAAAGIFFQGLLSALAQKFMRGSVTTHRRLIRFLPLMLPLGLAGLAYILAQTPAEPMPQSCNGQMITARIGEARFRLPIVKEVEIWPNDRRDTPQSLSRRDIALGVCKQAEKGEIPLAQFGFSWPHDFYQPSSDPWTTRYFGAEPPPGPASLCSRATSADERLLFCRSEKAPRFAFAPSMPEVSIKWLPQGSPMNLFAPNGPPVEVTASNAADVLPTLLEAYTSRSTIAGFDMYREGEHRLIFRTGSDNAKTVNVVMCRTEAMKNTSCGGITTLAGKVEMRFTFFLSADAPDAQIVATIARIQRFANRLGPGSE